MTAVAGGRLAALCCLIGWVGGALSAGVAKPDEPGPVTYYIRADGGLASQCDGRSDTPYQPQSGTRRCAWKHPLVALPPGGRPRIAGGDTLVIDQGQYMIGWGAEGAEGCSLDWTWDCFPAPVPSGPDAERPTRIVGKGHDAGCKAPPQLWGTQRTHRVLNLEGTKHAVIACLEITDHAACAVFHTGDKKCPREEFPYGPWAVNGLYAADSRHVLLRDLHIHGLAAAGILAGRVGDWTLENVRINGNGWAGWNGDVGEKTSSNTGRLTMRRVAIEWNGCVEAYPSTQPTSCWGQSAGGYGDGLATAETGGDWVIEDSFIRYNTQDGLDLLYQRQGSVTLRRVWVQGNAGNQIKIAGAARVENSVIVGNCGFFKGQKFTYKVDDCRAYGDTAVFVGKAAADRVSFVQNTVLSEGNTVLYFSGPQGARVLVQNNILIGRPTAWDAGKNAADVYREPGSAALLDDVHNLKAGLRNADCRATGVLCVGAGKSGLVGDSTDRFDPHLAERSPARGSGAAGAAAQLPGDDYYGKARRGGAAIDRGAVAVQ